MSYDLQHRSPATCTMNVAVHGQCLNTKATRPPTCIFFSHLECYLSADMVLFSFAEF